MAQEIKVNLSWEDTQRLFAIKKLQGKDKLTGGEFAEELLSKQLRRLFPGNPDVDEMGNIINASEYKG